MKREPSIHITRDSLRIILNSLGIEENYFIKEIMRRAKSNSIGTRTVTISTDKLEKKFKKITQSSRKDADLFAQVIYAIRKSKKHRGISHMKPGGKDWDILKEVAASALDFCNEFELNRRTGFIKFVEIAMDKMKKYSLVKFNGLRENISETYAAIKEIESDSDSGMTDLMYKIYFNKILEVTGITDESKELPDKYVWFVRARAQAEEMNIAPDLYIEAQFAALDFAKSIPHPTQLVGIKAKDRVIRYAYKNNINLDG